MIQNLFCILEWSVLWHLYHQTMFKAHLTNLLLWFAINMEMVQMEFWTTSRIIMWRGSVSMLEEVYQHFQLVSGICFTAQMTRFPRTNNAVEGWHRGFQTHVSTCHPVFWKFLEVFQKEETFVRVGILQNEGGHEPPP